MRNWLDCCPPCPAFMKRLWCQLAVTYTLLAICAFVLLIMIMYGLNDYKDFHKTRTLQNVEAKIVSEKPLIAQAIRAKNRPEWQAKVLSNIRESLIYLEESQDKIEIYRITNSSRPEVYIRLTDAQGQMLTSDPDEFPADIDAIFASQKPLIQQHVVWLNGRSGPVWVDMPVSDESGNLTGRLHLLYVAEFDWRIQFMSIMQFLFLAFDWVIICSVPIGITCGLVAARYVTNQLQKMNVITESWRQGNFDARIELPNDDVLIRHSQHLNDMAQDLAMYLSLKQNLAVSDERNRVARELHDTVKQKLFALGLQLATAKASSVVMQSAGEHILEAETITREAQHDLMEIITQLRPTGTSATLLYERISMIADDFTRRFGVNIDIRHTNAVQFSAHTGHHVLRIIQESLMNAVRHGKASAITITTTAEGDLSTLTITDNGHGFNTSQKPQGFGIISMRDRTRDLLQGTLDIQSTPGNGTTITLSWKNE